MKKLLFILLILTACSKYDLVTYTIEKGDNKFTPFEMITPNTSKLLQFEFRLGSEWELGQLTNSTAHGWKSPALGKLDYHDSGANWGIMWDERTGLTIHPRWYDNGVLNVLAEIPIQAGVWYICKLQTDPLRFWLDGVLVSSPDVSVSHGWLTPMYLGKNGFAIANRKLTIEYRKI